MRSLLNLVFNIIWLLSGGIVLALGYFLFGIIACIFIVTIPFGVASFRVAGYVLWPFGREVVAAPGAGVGSGIGNVIWFLVAGLWLALGAGGIAALAAVPMVLSAAGSGPGGVSLPVAAVALGATGLVGLGWTSLWVSRADRERGKA